MDKVAVIEAVKDKSPGVEVTGYRRVRPPIHTRRNYTGFIFGLVMVDTTEGEFIVQDTPTTIHSVRPVKPIT